MTKKTAARVELTHTQVVVVAAIAAALLLGVLKMIGPHLATAEERAPGLTISVADLDKDDAPDFGPVDPEALKSRTDEEADFGDALTKDEKSVLEFGPIKLPAPSIKIKRPEHRTYLSLLPQLAIASTRKHRVIEFESTHLLNESPKTREHEAIRVAKPFGASVERRLDKTYEFLLADELEARQVDGTPVSPEDLLALLEKRTPVVLIHTGTTLPSHFTKPLASDALIISIPREQKVWISAYALEPNSDRVMSSFKPRFMPIATYPELCTATAHELGVIELCSKHYDYEAKLERNTPTASLATREGLRDVALKSHLHSVLSTELAAYRKDGSQLSRDELLYALKEKTAVLATLAPAEPPAEYLSLLGDDAIVLHVPHEQAIDLVPKNDSKSALADGQQVARYYAPF